MARAHRIAFSFAHHNGGVRRGHGLASGGVGEGLVKVNSGIAEKSDFEGSILDVGSGTGSFGRYLVKAGKIKAPDSKSSSGSESRASSSPITPKKNVLVGIEISEAMVQAGNTTALYDYIHLGPMQAVLPKLERRFDHVVSLSSLHFIDTVTLSLVLNRMFEIAEKSVTVTVDDIPDVYNENLVKRGHEHMQGWNHTKEVKEFGVPKGWKVVQREWVFAWMSPMTGDKVYTTVWRWERV